MKSARNKPKRDESRRHPRLRADGITAEVKLEGGKLEKIEVVNVSLGGAMFVSKTSIRLGKNLFVELFRGDASSVKVVGRVVGVSQTEKKGPYGVRVRFNPMKEGLIAELYALIHGTEATSRDTKSPAREEARKPAPVRSASAGRSAEKEFASIVVELAELEVTASTQNEASGEVETQLREEIQRLEKLLAQKERLIEELILRGGGLSAEQPSRSESFGDGAEESSESSDDERTDPEAHWDDSAPRM